MSDEVEVFEEEGTTSLLQNLLVLQNREYGLTVLNDILSATQTILGIANEYNNDTICPYKQTIIEHLGTDYTPVPIRNIIVPQNFSIQKASEDIKEYVAASHEATLKQYQTMCELASSANFDGTFSPCLGNAFAVLSGDEYIIDKNRLKKHLDFLESLDTITEEDLDADPIKIAKQLLYKYQNSLI